MILVADVSNNNGSVDFNALRKIGVRAVYLKAAEGRNYEDVDFRTWRKSAHDAGLFVGAYHFARPEFSAASEALLFSTTVGSLGVRELRPVLDFEVADNVDPKELEKWARTWNFYVKQRLGVGPMLYSYYSFLSAMKLQYPIGYGLWLAAYGPDDGEDHPYAIPLPWVKAQLHQFTSKARVAGVRGECDLSHAASIRPLLARPIRGYALWKGA